MDVPGLVRRSAGWARRSRGLRIAGLVVCGLVALAFIVSFAIDEPLRRRTEAEMNRRLKGYSVTIGKADFHPIGLSLTLRDVVMSQDANPDPPVIRVPRLDASVQWRAIVFGRVVANFSLHRPVLYPNLQHLRKEAADPTPIDEHGWQDAVEAIYPLKINEFEVVDAQVTYVDDPKRAPLEMKHLNIVATNIRNVWSPDRVYPSTLRADAAVFDRGRLEVDGRANFLAEPFPGVKTYIKAEGVDLAYFKPVLARYNVVVHQGELALEGDVEYAPSIKMLALSRLVLDGAKIDYVHLAETKGAEVQRKEVAKQAAGEAANRPDLLVKVDELRATRGTFALVNDAKANPYRVFLADVDFSVKNFSNRFEEGPAIARLTGRFMGSGPTTAAATFRPEDRGPDFELTAKVEKTDMTRMNDLLRAYGKFDVVAGEFSVYSELKVKHGRVDGYVKPLFQNLKAYDRRQDEEKSAFRKLYERLVGGVSRLLENRPRAEVATKAEVHGPVENPKADTLQVVVRLVENAFFRAILPGFEREVATPRRGDKRLAEG